MARSPGHQQMPDHRVDESHIGEEMLVQIDKTIIADSRDVVRVDEVDQPTRWYFSRTDVQMQALSAAGTKTRCPFKGSADYFDVHVDGHDLQDAAWTYEVPYDEHIALEGRIAFHDEKFPDMQVVEVRR